MLLSICSEPETLKVLMIVKTVLNIIRIVVPILLIVSLTILYAKAVTDKDDDLLAKANKSLIPRLLAAILVIFVPMLIKLVLNIASVQNSEVELCFKNATPEGVLNAYINVADQNIGNVKKSLSRVDYNKSKFSINKIDDERIKESKMEELSKLEEYVKLEEEIQKISKKTKYDELKEIKNKISNVSDEEIKNKLQEDFKKAKEKFALVSEYPIVPFGEVDLYKNLQYFSNDSLKNLLERNNSSVEELNEKIRMSVETSGVGTREATVNAVITLIGTIAEYGYRLPYYWGGKRSTQGVDGNWGLYSASSYCNDYYFKTQDEIDYCIREMSYRGLDCSGLVNWAVVQGTQNNVSQKVTNNGVGVSLNASTANSAVCQIGDALKTPGHIVLVVGLDDENKRYIIAEESNGMEIRSVPYNGNRDGRQYSCERLDHNYIN